MRLWSDFPKGGKGGGSVCIGGRCIQQVQGSVLPGGAVHILVENRECGVQGYMIKVTGYVLFLVP